MSELKSFVSASFKEMTLNGYYDHELAKKVISMNDPLNEIPDKMYDFFRTYGKGDSFVFSGYLIKLLRDYGVESHMIFTSEGNIKRASVMYTDDRKLYVANPSRDIEYFTDQGILPTARERYYFETTLITKDNTTIDSSKIPLQTFADMYGNVSELGSLESNIPLGAAMKKMQILKKPKE